MVELTCERCGIVCDSRPRYEAHLARKQQCKPLQKPTINVITNDPDSILDKPSYDKIIDADKLDSFDTNNLMTEAANDDFSIIISASRKAGKSHMLSKLYPMWSKLFDLIIVFSYSAHNKTYDFVTGPKFPDYDPKIIDDIFRFQRKTGNLLRFLVIFDDLVSSNIKFDDSIMQCYTRGRNSRVSVCVSTQIFKLVNKNNRGNTDYMFIGKTNTTENRMTLCETVLMNNVRIPPQIKSKTAKIEYLDNWLLGKTKDHHFIVIDMKADSEKIYDYLAPN